MTNEHEQAQGVTAASHARQSVFLADSRQYVNTTLRRAEEIQYAADIELAGRSRDNYFALERIDRSAPELTRGVFEQGAKGVIGSGSNMFLTLYRFGKGTYKSVKNAWAKSNETQLLQAAFTSGQISAQQLNLQTEALNRRYENLNKLGRDALEVMRRNHESFMEKTGLARQEGDGLVYDLAAGASTLLAALGVSVITKSPAAVSALFGAYAGRQDYEEALQNGVSPKRAMLVGLAGGTVEGGLELVGLGALEKVFKGRGFLRAGLGGALTEGGQEGGQATAENIIMQNFGGREKELSQTFEDIAYSALLGALTGAPVAAVFNAGHRAFKEKGADDNTAKELTRRAVEHALSGPVQQEARRVLSNATSALNYQNGKVEDAAREFTQAVQKAPSREVLRKVYNVSERTEQNALNAGYAPEEAELLGQLEQSRANSIYVLAGIKPGAQFDLTKVRFEKTEQNLAAHAETLFQAAMYRNPEEDVVRFARSVTRQPQQDKSYFSTDVNGLEVRLPADTVLHDWNKHKIPDEDWNEVLTGLKEGIMSAALSDNPRFNGTPVLLKLQTENGYWGAVAEIQDGYAVITTAFKEPEQRLDKWMQKQASNAPDPFIFNARLTTPKGVAGEFVGRPAKYSIADVTAKIKAQKPDVYYQEDNAFFTPKETEKTTFKQELKESVNANLPAKKMLAVGQTPRLYVELGLPNLPLALPQNVVKKATRNKHQVDIKTVEQLPELVYNPVAVFKSLTQPNSLVALTSAIDKNGNPVVVVLKPTQNEINVIPSLYGKDNFDNFVRKNILEESVLYLDKEQAVKTIRKQELQLLKWDSPNGLINSIRTKEDFVNLFPDDSVYFQGPSGARGSVEFKAGEAIIRALKSADKSTALHEFFHVWEWDLYRAEKVSNDSEFLELAADIRSLHADSGEFVRGWVQKTNLLKADQKARVLQTIDARGNNAYLARLAQDDELDAKDFTARVVRRAFRENFAQLAEKYVAKGHAPNEKLKNIFEKFAEWLREIYTAFSGRTNISDAAQSIFERLLTRRAAQVDSSRFTGKVEQLKNLVKNIRQGQALTREADLGMEELKALIAQLDAPRPAMPKEDLLKTLRKSGARYSSAARIDKDVYKNARVFDRENGIDDRPDVWLKDRGYMDFEEATADTEAAAWETIQRALDGEKIYPLGASEQVKAWENYKRNIDTLREVFGGNAREAQQTFKQILELEEKGYRVVEKKDLTQLSLRLDELDRLAGDMENKGKNTRTYEEAQKRNLDAARKIKRTLMAELEKRRLTDKKTLVDWLDKAKTTQDIRSAAADVLEYLEKAYEKTPEGLEERRKSDVPDTDWDRVKLTLLKDFNKLVETADEQTKKAWEDLSVLSKYLAAGKILTEEQASVKEKAQRLLSARMEGKYITAMEKVLREEPHISPEDVRKFTASYAKTAARYKLLNAYSVDKFIGSAKKLQAANYKKYITGKIGAALARKRFEKAGAARRAKYTPEVLEFLDAANNAWNMTHKDAAAAFTQAVNALDPNNPPSPVQALTNRIIWTKADPDGVTPQDLKSLYDDTLALLRADRTVKNFGVLQRAVSESRMRTLLGLALKERKLPTGTQTFILNAGTDFQTALQVLFGEYEYAMPDDHNRMVSTRVNFREALAPEINQIQEHNFKAAAEKDILRTVGDAYGLKTPYQILDKIAELQKVKTEVLNYGYVKDEQEGELIATVFKNGKPANVNKPRPQTLDKLEIMTLYIWNKDHEIIDGPNSTVKDVGLAGRIIRAYGSKQLENMFALLTPQDIRAADNMQKLAEKHYRLESATHSRIYGFPLPKKEFYFPSVADRITGDIDMKEEFVANSKAPGFIKERVKSNRIIQRPVNPLNVLRTHMRRAGEFIFNAEKFTELKRVFKDSSMESAFMEKFGETDGKKIYQKLLSLVDMQAPQKSAAKGEFYKTADRLFNGWVKAVMGFKPITGIKQFAGSINFAEHMPAHKWIAGFLEGLSHPQKTLEFMISSSPYIQTRYETGGMNEAVARAMAADEISPVKEKWNNFTNLMLLNTRMGDKASLVFGGYPYLKYLTEEKGMPLADAVRVFEKQATRTLQSSLRVHLSQGQANADSLPARLFLVFKNQQLQYVRKVAEAYVSYRNGEITAAQFAKTGFLYLIMNPVIYTALSLGWWSNDDDERKEDVKRLLTGPVTQFFGAYPLGEGVADFFVDNALSIWKDQKLTAPQRSGLPMFDDIYKDIARLVKSVNTEEDLTLSDILGALFEASKYTGLPTQTIKNTGHGFYDAATGKPIQGGLKLLGYTSRRTAKITGEDK